MKVFNLSKAMLFSALTLFMMSVTTNSLAKQTMKNYIKLPIDTSGGMFTIDTKVNDKLAKLYIDTGSTSSVIDEKRLEEFGLTVDKSKTEDTGITIASNEASFTPIEIPKLTLDSISIKDVPAVAMSVEDINYNNPNPVAGILGQDILLANHAMLSFKEPSLLWPSTTQQSFTIPSKGILQLTTLDNGFFIATIEIDGVATKLLLDSGSPDIILDKSALPSSKKLNQSGDMLSVKSVKIASHNLQRKELLVMDLSHIAQWIKSNEGIEIKGTLGLKALQDSNSVLDLAAAKLYIN